MNSGIARRRFLQLTLGAAAAPYLTGSAARAAGRVTEYLGRGIDIFHADPWGASLKEVVFSKVPALDKIPLDQIGIEQTYAESFLDITHKIAVEAGVSGSYGGFSASVKSKFSRSEESTENRKFMRISALVSGDRIFIRGGKDALMSTLSDDFKSALASSSPADLFAKFGTHVAIKMRIGGKAEYFCQSVASSQMSREDFEIAATAKYQSLGGSVEGSTKYSESSSRYSKEIVGSNSLFTVGGTARLAANIAKGGWAEWADSTAAVPGFLGFDELVPIWDFAQGRRRDIIKTAYHRRAAKALRPEIISVTSEIKAHPDASVALPSGYKLICGGARDNWDPSGNCKESCPVGNLLTASFPEVDPPKTSTATWHGRGKDHIKSDPASVSVYAMAIYDPDNIWDVYIHQEKSFPAHVDYWKASVPEGYVLVGGGALAGENHMLIGSYPVDERTWVAASKQHLEDVLAPVTAYAVGLKSKVPGIKLMQSISTSESGVDQHPQAQRSPDDGVMVGGGALVKYGGDGLLLTASYPKDSRTWAAWAKDHITKDTGTVTAYCIELQVLDEG